MADLETHEDPTAADAASDPQPAVGPKPMFPDNAFDEILKGGEAKIEAEDNPNDTDPDAAPEPVKPKPEPEPEKKPEPAPEPEPAVAEPDEAETVLSQLNETLEKINRKLDEPTERAPAPGRTEPSTEALDPALKAMLEHEDPAVRDWAKSTAEKLQKQDERLGAVEQHLTGRAIQEEAVRVEAEITTVAETYGIPDAKGVVQELTADQVEAVCAYLESDPVLASTLTFREGLLRKYPTATLRPTPAKTNGTPAKASTTVAVPGKPREDGKAVIDSPAAAGTVPRAERKPAKESMEQAVGRGLDKLLGVD